MLRWVNLTRTNTPSEPVTTDELKSWLRVTHSDDDSKIASLGQAAREYLEDQTRRAFTTQTWKVTCQNNLETGKAILLPRPRLISISSVDYIDEDGNEVTGYASTNYYHVAGEDGAIWFKTLPDTASVPEPLRITFSAGYGAASAVPEALKTAIKTLVAEWYYNRTATGQSPEWVTRMVQNYKVPMV